MHPAKKTRVYAFRGRGSREIDVHETTSTSIPCPLVPAVTSVRRAFRVVGECEKSATNTVAVPLGSRNRFDRRRWTRVKYRGTLLVYNSNYQGPDYNAKGIVFYFIVFFVFFLEGGALKQCVAST